MSKEIEYTTWFKEIIIQNHLLKYFEDSLPEFSDFLLRNGKRESVQYYQEDNVQFFDVEYLAPISVDQVEIREEDIRNQDHWKWDKYKLNRVYINPKTDKIIKAILMPRVYREYDLDNPPIKFKIDGGNHRFNFAKQQNIPTVMSLVTDTYTIRRTWVELHLEDFLKEKEIDDNNPDVTVINYEL